MKARNGVAATVVVWVLMFGAPGSHGLSAQQATFTRTVLQQQSLSVPGREAVTAMAELQAGAVLPRHTHPGEEIGYVLEAGIVMEVDGRPSMTLKAGDSFFIPAGAPHTARNVGVTSAKILAVYVVETGKPLASPAP